MTDVVDTFVRLFRGRGDVRWNWATKRPIYEPVTRIHFERHLKSADPADWLGVYPLLGHLASWGCVDIDKTDDPTIALRLQGALRYKDVPSWVERTDNGYHVWVFPKEPLVEAETMRRALYAACAAIGYQPREVNPKQPQAKKVGNLVRAPLNGALVDARRDTRWLIDQDENSLDDFLANIDAFGRAETAALEVIAALWAPPQRDAAELGDLPALSSQLTDKMSGRTFIIFRDGPLPGSDRSGTMVRLAAACAADGLTPAETASVLKGCSWNKYRDRPDEDEQIDKLVSEYA